MKIARAEVFVTVLTINRVKNIDKALVIENANPSTNTCSVFKQSGRLAN